MTDLFYDEENYSPTCATCGGSDFKRYRVIHEQQILDLRDGTADVVDSDLHDQSDWTIECDRCGNSSDELEDLLTELPDDDDEEDDDA